MKGKRYLDVCLRTRESFDEEDSSQTSTQSPSQPNDGTIWSVLTFGYFGGQTRKSPILPPSDTGVVTSPPSGVAASHIPLAVTPNGTAFTPSKSPLKSVIGEILFVQDRSYLIIIKPEAAGRSVNSSEKKGRVICS